MNNTIDLASKKDLNVGNSYTYNVTATDQKNYSSFFVTTTDTVTISDGTNSLTLTLAANEEVKLSGGITSIVGTVTNVLVFQY